MQANFSLPESAPIASNQRFLSVFYLHLFLKGKFSVIGTVWDGVLSFSVPTFCFSSAVVLVPKWAQVHSNLICLTFLRMKFNLAVHSGKLKVIRWCCLPRKAGSRVKTVRRRRNHSAAISFFDAFTNHLGLLWWRSCLEPSSVMDQ